MDKRGSDLYLLEESICSKRVRAPFGSSSRGLAHFADGAPNGIDRTFKLLLCRAQGRHEDDRVEDWPSEQAVLARGEAHLGARLILPWKGFAGFFLNFDSGNVAALADVADIGEGSQVFQQFAQERDFSPQGFQCVFLLENSQTRKGRDAA
jgi:hypothetical protein